MGDPHNTMLEGVFKKQKLDYCFLDIHRKNEFPICGYDKSGAFISYRGEKIKNPLFYVSSPLRQDSSMMIGVHYKYPQVYRSAVNQYIEDLGFIFPDRWFPGSPQIIKAADSKLFLLTTAADNGLTIPKFTLNGQNPLKCQKVVYKKCLGYPLVISSKKGFAGEVAITRTNKKMLNKGQAFDGLPWQWQEPIVSKYHVRVHIVGDNVWSVATTKENDLDLRSLKESEFTSLDWKTHELPVSIKNKLRSLMRKLGLTFASPEFIIDNRGNYILIDFNPCGDWVGFFDNKISLDICEEHVSLLK